ncbi:hypothetical protein L596_014705 [Steinernema carpocapsae]|uniref:Uncharacterized protein n=1 Tax=Steinernema carpocapsae TaxID=34508 RepID=A0A4U5NCN6_STECR|nr:hypothetical protein L596_014705 [Steinernema carpocapsae]
MRSSTPLLVLFCAVFAAIFASSTANDFNAANWYTMRILNRLPAKRNYLMAQYADHGLHDLAKQYGGAHVKRSAASADDEGYGNKRNSDMDLFDDPTADWTIKFGKRNAAAENLENMILRLGRR